MFVIIKQKRVLISNYLSWWSGVLAFGYNIIKINAQFSIDVIIYGFAKFIGSKYANQKILWRLLYYCFQLNV